MDDFHYVGTELDVFVHATNWKSYVHTTLRNYLRGDVLEVGAGIGAATELLNDGTPHRWLCLEPDRRLAERIKGNLRPALRNCEVAVGALSDLRAREDFDAILYMDVLEHIEDDKAELARAANLLRPNGSLLVLAPAFPWLYTPFDSAIGHFRRYTRHSLRTVAPEGLREERVHYLDSIGMLASAGNRLLLRSATPSVGQIRLWDRVLVPLSKIVDPFVAHSFGRSVLAVWRKPP
jgi:SAM-dependent methyltransferase